MEVVEWDYDETGFVLSLCDEGADEVPVWFAGFTGLGAGDVCSESVEVGDCWC